MLLGAVLLSLAVVVTSSILVARWKVRAGAFCKYRRSLSGKVVMVTGVSQGGMGFAQCREYLRAGATVVMVDRDLAKLDSSARNLRQMTGVPASRIELVLADLQDLKACGKVARDFLNGGRGLDLLVCNAAVLYCPLQRSAQGFELVWANNFLSHFALVRMLLPALRRAEGSRVLLTSSETHWTRCAAGGINWNTLKYEECAASRYDRMEAYSRSKTAMALLARDLARRDRNVKFFAVDPGSVNTHITRYMPLSWRLPWSVLPIARTVDEGIQTALHCAFAPDSELVSGQFYRDCRLSPSHPYLDDETNASKLWDHATKATEVSLT